MSELAIGLTFVSAHWMRAEAADKSLTGLGRGEKCVGRGKSLTPVSAGTTGISSSGVISLM